MLLVAESSGVFKVLLRILAFPLRPKTVFLLRVLLLLLPLRLFLAKGGIEFGLSVILLK